MGYKHARLGYVFSSIPSSIPLMFSPSLGFRVSRQRRWDGREGVPITMSMPLLYPLRYDNTQCHPLTSADNDPQAILACAGYMESEPYDPHWRHIIVPTQFEKLAYPMAEAIVTQTQGKPNLTGTAKFWTLMIALRPYLFQASICSFSSDVF